MLSLTPPAVQPTTTVVSPRVYGLIVDQPDLLRRLLPEGLGTSPYEILDYHATLTLLDPQGSEAVFRRTQRIRFLQEGVASILDHLWGDGVQVAGYDHTAGPIRESFHDGGVRHLVIDLPRPMRRGETYAFSVARTARASFTQPEEWLETTIDHPITTFHQQIYFPKERSCQQAELVIDDQVEALTPVALEDGRALLEVERTKPPTDTPISIRWRW
jgi:hypothetical protein